jgi:hypothetical protein
VREDGRAVLFDMVHELNGAGLYRVGARLERSTAGVSHVRVGCLNSFVSRALCGSIGSRRPAPAQSCRRPSVLYVGDELRAQRPHAQR